MNQKNPEPPTDPATLRREIAARRAELGDTVEALAAKADVKAQMKKKVDAGKQRLQDAGTQAKQRFSGAGSDAKHRLGATGSEGKHAAEKRPVAPAVIGLAVAAVVTAVLYRRFKR